MNGSNRVKWEKAVEEEYQRFEANKCFEVVDRKDVGSSKKIMTSTWAMKMKSSGNFRARLNARGYEQVKGEHYTPNEVSSPVTSDVTIRVILVLMIMADWSDYLADVNGAFLMGDFEDDDEEIYMEIPKGFEKKYALDKVLRLLKTIYGLKQAARMFWKLLLKAMRVMKFEMSKVDPCLYWKRTKNGLVI